MSSDQLLNSKTSGNTHNAALFKDSKVSAEAASNILTDVVIQIKGINFDRLEGCIINVVDTPIDGMGQMGDSNGDSYGKWTNLPIIAEAATQTNPDNSINITTILLGGKTQMSSVEYIQSVLGIHEYRSHGLLEIPQEYPAHSKAYKLQLMNKQTFHKLSNSTLSTYPTSLRCRSKVALNVGFEIFEFRFVYYRF